MCALFPAAGTVLETEAPAPGLTRDEELRVTRVYEEIISASSSGNDKKKKKKPAKAEEGDGDEDNAAVTAAFEETGTEEKGEEEAEGKVSESQADADATANTEGEGGEEKDAGDEPAAEPPKTAAAPASGAAGGEGLSLDDVRTALTQLDLTLDDEQFERYVVKFLVSHGLDPSRDSDDGTAGPRLELDGFLALVSVVRTPGHAFGGLLRKAAARADDEKVCHCVGFLCSCVQSLSSIIFVSVLPSFHFTVALSPSLSFSIFGFPCFL